MPKRPAVLALTAAFWLAALLLCGCMPTRVQPDQARQSQAVPPSPGPSAPGQTDQAAVAGRSSRAVLAAFHLRDERGSGPAEALKVLDEPGGPAQGAESGELALRALALSQLGRYAEAVAALDRLILTRRDLPPEALADAFVERGLALAALGHQARASEDYGAALVLAPRHIPALLARADQFFALGQPGQAEEGYSEVIKIAPENTLARINRGVTRDEQGRFREAIEDFTRALELDPLSPVALVNRGVSRSQAGDLPGMCADYREACRLGACHRLESAQAMGYCQGAR